MTAATLAGKVRFRPLGLKRVLAPAVTPAVAPAAAAVLTPLVASPVLTSIAAPVVALALFTGAVAAFAWLAGVSPLRLAVWLMLMPLAEEIVLRAGLQEALLRRAMAHGAANLITALVFATAHVLLRGEWAAAMVALPALVLGALYGRTRQLRGCVALHAAMNGFCLAVGLLGLWPEFLR
jgi:membrane protease YdiL (CAAX protease family)